MELDKVTLWRTDFTDSGTFGRITFKYRTLDTGELPWRNNAKDISCVPAGEYSCVWGFSPRFQKFTYLLKEVPGRNAIRIHAANYMGDRAMKLRSQLDGCIALGDGFGWLDKQQFLKNSAESVRLFDNTMKGDAFTLVIANRFTQVI